LLPVRHRQEELYRTKVPDMVDAGCKCVYPICDDRILKSSRWD
jgi:hypothetical protein